MSFFQKLFGGGNNKDKASPPLPHKSEEINIEKTLSMLDEKIRAFEEKEKKLIDKLKLLRNQAKDMLRIQNKKQAKEHVKKAIKVTKQAESYSLRKKILVGKKFQMEQQVMNMETTEVLKIVTWNQPRSEQNLQRLQDIFPLRQREIIQKMKYMVGEESDDEQVDDMLNELMKELRIKNNSEVQQGSQVSSINATTSNKAKQKEADDIDEMLGKLQQA